MLLTDAELHGIGAQAFNMARRDLERKCFNFLFASYFRDDTPPLHRMDEAEKMVIQNLGEDWLNSGRTKDFGFMVLRKCVDLMPPDAVAIATVCNRFSLTAKGNALPKEKKDELIGGGHDRCHRAVAEGIFAVRDALVAIVQTPDRVCQYVQNLDSRARPEGGPEVLFHPQEGFGGRIKMFGEEKD